jgi:hypothetical protein
MYIVFILWIALLPFISFAGSFEGPKIVVFWAGGLLLTLYYAVIVWQKKLYSADRSLVIFSLWVAVLAVSSLFGIHPLESFLGGSYRHQGVLFFFTLILVAGISKKLQQTHLKQLYFWGSAAGIMQSIVVLHQSFVLHSQRPIGTFGEPNAAAGFLVLSMFWVVAQKSHPILLRAVTVVCISVGVLLTQSRAGIGMMIAVLSLFGANELVRTRRSAVITGIIVGVISCAILIGFVEYRKITTIRLVSQFENRSMFFRVGVEEFLNRPFLGYGAESGEAIYYRHFSRISMPLVDYMIDLSHNLFLDVALWSGGTGLLVLLDGSGMLLCVCIRHQMFTNEFCAGLGGVRLYTARWCNTLGATYLLLYTVIFL